MHLTPLFSALCLLVSTVSAAAPKITPEVLKTASLTQQNNYGAPIPPWQPGSHPGWYYGTSQNAPSGLVCIVAGLGELLCDILGLLGLCPVAPPTPPPTLPPPVGGGGGGSGGGGGGGGGSSPPPPPPPKGYEFAYQNYTCATEETPGDYITFGLVELIQGCANMCDAVDACKFANSYHDNNVGSGKNFTTLLTCSLFATVTTILNATNCGGQDQHGGGLTNITESYGLIKL
ncbi:hypothetical protein B0H12DRAFT_1191846 [Mycena haematopus]|nr:hypothetical protein B0H12DRAFT_1191846 [Mycena haematopus]